VVGQGQVEHFIALEVRPFMAPSQDLLRRKDAKFGAFGPEVTDKATLVRRR
jgi:hypothetical protein